MFNKSKITLLAIIFGITTNTFCFLPSSLFPFWKTIYPETTSSNQKKIASKQTREMTGPSIIQYPYFLPIIKRFKNTSQCSEIKKLNFLTWAAALGLTATGFAAWYKRDAITIGWEKFAAFIKKY
jgi:hypothetical protein